MNGNEIANLSISDGIRQIRCWKKVGNLEFYTNTLQPDCLIQINDSKYKLDEDRFNWIEQSSYTGYRRKISLSGIIRTGYNKLQITERESGKIWYEVDFFYDPSFSFYSSRLEISRKSCLFWTLESAVLVEASDAEKEKTAPHLISGPLEMNTREIELAIPSLSELPPLWAKIKVGRIE